MRVNNLPKVVTRKRKAGDQTRDLLSRKSNALPNQYTIRPQMQQQIATDMYAHVQHPARGNDTLQTSLYLSCVR